MKLPLLVENGEEDAAAHRKKAPMKLPCSALNVGPDITLYHTGPALDYGPLPSFFYFSISGPDSLMLDPFNQPVQFLHGEMIRVFSMTLPGHENGLPAKEAMSLWAEDISKGIDCVGDFLEKAKMAIDFAIREKFVNPHKMATGGLSRGGFIAAHLAARDERFRFLLGFAPLTKLGRIKEFHGMKENTLVRSLDLTHLSHPLSNRHVRLYIGNQDTRVGTHECFEFAMSLVEHKKQAQVELFITPSIGQMGHGTPPEIFQQGAQWIAKSISL